MSAPLSSSGQHSHSSSMSLVSSTAATVAVDGATLTLELGGAVLVSHALCFSPGLAFTFAGIELAVFSPHGQNVRT